MTFSRRKPHRRVVFFYLLPFTFLLLLWSSCEQNTTQPPPPAGPDTTSHNFTWQVTHVGDLTSSLADVFAIAEDDIWAVGKIQIEDSAGNDIVYNAVHWNGQEWEPQRIRTNSCGGVLFPPIRSVFSFSNANIFFAHIDGSITIYDGNSFISDCRMIQKLNGSDNKMWGISSSDLYVVSNSGAIVHYDGSNWQKQESNTTVRLLDVWGNTNGSTVWACGYASNNSESILLRSDGSQWQTVWQWQFQQGASDSAYVGLLSSLWAFDPDSLIIVSGDGVFRQDIANNGPPRKEKVSLGAFPNNVRGSAPNNIFIACFNGTIWHYNGATWRTYPELHNPNWVFRSIAVLEDKVVAVGGDFSQGIQRDIIVTGLRP